MAKPSNAKLELDRVVKTQVDESEKTAALKKLEILKTKRLQACQADIATAMAKHRCRFNVRITAEVDNEGLTHHAPVMRLEALE